MKPFIRTAIILAAVAAMAAPTTVLGEGIGALPAPVFDTDFYANDRHPPAKVELGRLLFFDKILSGNRNISCASCHHPRLAGTDRVALPLGEGPKGLGPERRAGSGYGEGVHGRVPRNSPALFNVGAREFRRMFHDGRVEIDVHGHYESGFISPARWKLPTGLDNVLAAQALFPPTSPEEMAGQKGENPIADARSLNKVAGPTGVWSLLEARLKANGGYVRLFQAAYPDRVEGADDVTIVLAANAIAAFQTKAFRADDSAFDQFLRTGTGLAPDAQKGLALFYGKARCATCHSGKFQSDHEFHAIAMPQIGPGKGDGTDGAYWRETGLKAFLEDFGRGRVTARSEDNYKFRTPSLRNVALTGPWGHAGAYRTLEDVVRHHLDPVASLHRYEPPQDLLLPIGLVIETRANGPQLIDRILDGQRLQGFLARDQFVMRNDALRGRIAAANELRPIALSDDEVSALIAFLHALTDPASQDLTHLVPDRVPSGLPVAD